MEMKRLIEAVVITTVLAIVADPALLMTGISFFRGAGQMVSVNSENIALGTVQVQAYK
jgi:hypothetical protein